jgi:hypothetical protein
MSRFRTRTFALSLALALTIACASLSLKQQVSQTHQAVHQALVAVDDAERALCQPAPSAVNTCANPAAAAIGLTDAKHQALSQQLAQAYAIDAKVGAAVIAWRAGDPVPSDLQTLLTYATQILQTASTLTDQPLIDRAQTYVARVQSLVQAFSK